MRSLKKKISLALQAASRQPSQILIKMEEPEPSSFFFVKLEESSDLKGKLPIEKKKPAKNPSKKASSGQGSKRPKRQSNINKNIIKNYARAMLNFALSTISFPYLETLIRTEKGVSIESFQAFLDEKKDEITSIRKLREILLATEDDGEAVSGCKRVFKELCLIFIRDFSVNWIYHSKVSDKLTHVKYRFKILRRVQSPVFFTYLESFHSK